MSAPTKHKIFEPQNRPSGFSWKAQSTMGVKRGGEILSIEGLDADQPAYKYQDDKTKPREIKRWPSKGKDAQGKDIPGDVIYQVIVQVQSDERDPSDMLDDGRRTFYIEMTSLWRINPGTKQRVQITDTKWAAFVLALEEAGTPLDSKVGGYLYFTWIGERPGKGANETKLWSAEYIPPTAAVFQQTEEISSEQVEDDRPSWLPEIDPKATVIAALKLAIVDAPDRDAIVVLSRQAVQAHGPDIWTPELKQAANDRLVELDRPKVSAATFNPFA
jgi:hypothetical protein